MKSLSYLRFVMMGLALLVFTIGRADAGMTEKSMKQDEMKKTRGNPKSAVANFRVSIPISVFIFTYHGTHPFDRDP